MAATVPTRYFDPQGSVDIIFRDGEEEFEFEREINAYLLLAWCTVPSIRKTMDVTAASVGLYLTLTVTNKSGKSSQITNLNELRRRLCQDWYENFYRNFVTRSGGLRKAAGALSFPQLDSSRRRFYQQHKREIEMIRLYACLSRPGALLQITRAEIELCLREDVLEKGTEFYRNVGKQEREIATKGEHDKYYAPGLKKSSAQKLWDNAPDQIVLAFALEPIAGFEIEKVFNDSKIFWKLRQSELIGKVRDCLRVYETIMVMLENANKKTDAARRWRVMRAPEQGELHLLPSLSLSQLNRLKVVAPNLAAKVEHLPRTPVAP